MTLVISGKANHDRLMKLNLNIEDIVPREVEFKLATLKKPLTLRPWSLRVRLWAERTYGRERLEEILRTHQLKEISEIAYFMLKENGEISYDDFVDNIRGIEDVVSLARGILGSIGFGEKEIKYLENQAKADSNKAEKKKKQIGV